jgi:hypothetical protein
MSILTYAEKGGSLSYPELDSNFDQLDTRTRIGWRDNVVELTIRNGPSEPQLSTFRGGIMLPAFVQTDVQSGYGNFHIDHDYAPGTAIYPHVHWSVDGSQVGTVRWGFEWTYAKGHQQMAFGATQTFYVEMTTTGTPYMHYVSECSDLQAIPGTNVETDGFILLRVFRDATHPNDTYDDQVFGIAIDLHYQVSQASTPFKAPNFFTGP